MIDPLVGAYSKFATIVIKVIHAEETFEQRQSKVKKKRQKKRESNASLKEKKKNLKFLA